MGKRYKDAGAVCPYYCSEEPSKIYCKGDDAGQYFHMAWVDGKDKKKFKFRCCRDEWWDCPFNQNLNRQP